MILRLERTAGRQTIHLMTVEGEKMNRSRRMTRTAVEKIRRQNQNQMAGQMTILQMIAEAERMILLMMAARQMNHLSHQCWEAEGRANLRKIAEGHRRIRCRKMACLHCALADSIRW